MKKIKTLGLFALVIMACSASQQAQETTVSNDDAVTQQNNATAVTIEESTLAEEQPTETQDDKWVAPAWADTIKNPFAKPDVNKADLLAAGKKVYNKYCWTCHGKTGKGDGPAGANLNPKPMDHTSPEVQQQSDGSLFWKITTGNSPMASYEKLLTPEQRWQVISYIRELGK